MPSLTAAAAKKQAPASRLISRPAEPAEPIVLRRYGALVATGYRDARTAKVAIVRCDCGKVVEAPTEALAAGEILNCGRCRAAPATPDARSDSFATSVADTERWGAKKRHFGGGGAR